MTLTSRASLAFAVVGLAFSHAHVAAQSGSPLEQAQLEEALRARRDKDDLGEYLRVLDELLLAHPENRPARDSRAMILMNDGSIEKAKADIAALIARSKEYPHIAAMQRRLAEITDSKDERIRVIQRILDDQKAGLDYASGYNQMTLEAELKETKGDLAGAESILDEYVKHPERPFRIEAYARYHLRHGQYERAIAEFKVSEAGQREQRAQSTNMIEATDPNEALDRLNLARAYWANGDLRESLGQLMAAFDIADDPARGQYARSLFRTEIVLHAYVLTHKANIGTPDEKTRSANALRGLAERVKVEDLHRLDIVLAFYSGKLSKNEATAKLEGILKVAPKLEWAVWSYVYLGFESPEEGRRIAPRLPAGSMERHILEEHLKTLGGRDPKENMP